jgi:thiol-disulfide isomerase/thioredoxin
MNLTIMKSASESRAARAVFVSIGLFLAPIPALAQATPGATPVASLKDAVSALEDAFVAKVETAREVEPLFDAYEKQLQQLIEQHPGDPAPFLGFMELFEKCDVGRTRRLLEEILNREQLPDKIRPAYEELRKKVDLVGKPLALKFTALDGSTVRFEELRGKVVVVDFWATWCGPCVRDLPKLQALYAEHRSAGLEVVGISFDRERAKLDAFLKARALPWRQIFPNREEQAAIAHAWGVTGGYLPTVFIVGKDGRLRHTLDARFRTAEKLAALLKE